jgi:hypothetical protein
MRKRLVDEFNLSPLSFLDAPLSRLQYVVKYATDKDHASELIDKAKVLTSRDWRQEINVFRKKPVMEDCVHEFEGIEVCKICGFKRKL